MLASINTSDTIVIMGVLISGRTFGGCLRSCRSLKTLSIFQDDQGNRPLKSFLDTNPLSGVELAHDGHLLEQLSVSFAIDARDYFRRFWEKASRRANDANPAQALPRFPRFLALNKKWPNLRCLALTCTLLHPQSPNDMIDCLLEAAGMAAGEMPSLREMEIWNHDKDSNAVFIFQYRRDGDNKVPTIYVSSTWAYKVAPSVVSEWNETSKEHEGRDIRVREQTLDLAGLGSRSCGHVIGHLKLCGLVLEPVSRCQLIWEELIDRVYGDLTD